MGKIAEDVIDGWSCSWCGIYFEKEHGYPVACRSCWKETLKGYKDEDDLRIESGVQKAIFAELSESII